VIKRAVLAVAILALLAASSASAAQPEFTITEAAGAGFPFRSYVLSLQKEMQVDRSGVSVRENGGGVADLRLTTVGENTTQQFGTVLAIDTSISMRGRPIEAAMEAARALAAQRKDGQLLGVIGFNGAVTTTLPLTGDPAAISRALDDTPALAFGTRIYDAVDAAVTMLKEKKVDAGSIILLSDGADVGSQLPQVAAARRLREAHIRVFTVGLTSRFFDRAALQALARDAGGAFTLAKNTDSLAGIYDQLGSRLARDYLIQYRSLAAAGTHVVVQVRVRGLTGVATGAYESPSIAALTPKARGPYTPPVSRRVWTSFFTGVLVALLAAGLIGVGTYSVLSGPRKGTVRRRMAEFVSVPAVVKDRQRPIQLTDRMLAGTETILRGSSRWQKFKWELEVAEVKTPAAHIVALTIVGSLLVILLVQFVGAPLWLAILFAAGLPYAVRSLIKRDLDRRRRQFAEQLPDNLQVLASALRAGHSFVGALSVVVDDAPEPARSEFQRVIADEQLGVPLDQALHVVVERMENRELEQVALVAAVQRDSGGNTAEVLDQVTATIRERFELRRTVRTLTAQGRMSRWVLTGIPVGLFAFISLVNPGYMSILYESTTGKVLMVMAAISVFSGSLIIKKIVDIKV
jgi:tight adherence protein B